MRAYFYSEIEENGTTRLIEMELWFSRSSKYIIRSVILSACIYFSKPGVFQIYAVETGTVTNETFVASFHDEYVNSNDKHSYLFVFYIAST